MNSSPEGFKFNMVKLINRVAADDLGCQTGRMASVVFFRAVNVGGHQTFQPGKLAQALADFGVVNIGAAGTFAVREKVGQTALRTEILSRLPFKPELMICSAREVLSLAAGDWFPARSSDQNLGRFVSVLAKPTPMPLTFPVEVPPGPNWEVRLVALAGPFVISVRRLGGTYSNAVVEQYFGRPATTRNWNTIDKICEALQGESIK